MDTGPPQSSPVRNLERDAQVWTSKQLSQEVPLELWHAVIDRFKLLYLESCTGSAQTSSRCRKLKAGFLLYSRLPLDLMEIVGLLCLLAQINHAKASVLDDYNSLLLRRPQRREDSLFRPRFVNNVCFHLRMSVLRCRG